MEKKSNSGKILSPIKGVASDNAKKRTESNTKPFISFSKRREPPNPSCSKNDAPRKPDVVKHSKFTDKRPRSRGQFSEGRKDSKVGLFEDQEHWSYVPRSKKHNLKHLLNFHLPPRNVNNGSSYKLKYNKEQFLQANCQFVVKEGHDYSRHFVDPDLLVDWSAIEEIRLNTSDILSCPICLHIPVVAKMTRCGHIYCWPCLLHYLALSDRTWCKCPICFEAVHRQDLKTVSLTVRAEFNVGEEIEFKLMNREKCSLVPVPVEQQPLQMYEHHLHSVSADILKTMYSKLLLATPKEVKVIIEKERDQLLRQLEEIKDTPEMCFVEQALELLAQREQSSPVAEATLCKTVETKLRVSESSDEGATGVEPTINTEEEDVMNVSVEDLAISQERSKDGAPKPYYFYQAADGQCIYLHALNIKMLEEQYGTLDKCPLRVKGKIIEKDQGSMTEELRKRLRYLKHLPLTTHFTVAEIDLSGCVSSDVIHSFEGQLEVREMRRRKRAREERRREKRIMTERNLKLGRQPTPHLKIDSLEQFPSCGTETNYSSNRHSSPVMTRSSSMSSFSSISTIAEQHSQLSDVLTREPLSASASLNNAGGPSFAEMLRDGKTNTRRSPRGPAVSEENDHFSTSVGSVDSDLESEYTRPPLYKQTFRDAFTVALEKADLENNLPKSSTKKKKRKQKVLFVTGMACSSK